MAVTADPDLSVFFDGACHLCSREIDVYRRKDVGNRIRFVDISQPEFDAAAHGLDAKRVQRVMHVQRHTSDGDTAGQVRTGVAAFFELWRMFPETRWMARVGAFPLLRPFLELGYVLFAAVRPYLPKRKRDACDDGTCAR